MTQENKHLWDGRKILISVGPGGVGKTTASAALGLAAASQGKNTLVMTVDPSRRLANSLGLSDLPNVAHQIPNQELLDHGLEVQAPFSAMIPNVKRIFDDLVQRSNLSRQRQQDIIDNPIYQRFSSTLAGSLEYAAVEKLYEIYTSKRYDLIILDTPPAQNAVDFLEAPQRIVEFLSNESLQWLIKPYVKSAPVSQKILSFGSSLINKTLGKMAGAETMGALADFIIGFQGMYEGFVERSRAVQKLLMDEETAFVVVTSGQRQQQQSALHFYKDLRKQGFHIAGFIGNRMLSPIPALDDGPRIEDFSRGLKSIESSDIRIETLQALDFNIARHNKAEKSIKYLKEQVGQNQLLILPEIQNQNPGLASLVQLQRKL